MSVDEYVYHSCIVHSDMSYLRITPLKSKTSNDALQAFKEFLMKNKSYPPPPKTKPIIITWHTENDGELVSNDIDEFCAEFAVNR